MNRKLILKSPRIVPFCANLSHFYYMPNLTSLADHCVSRNYDVITTNQTTGSQPSCSPLGGHRNARSRGRRKRYVSDYDATEPFTPINRICDIRAIVDYDAFAGQLR